MIIDCHGHYTTAPKALEAYRPRQIEGLKDPALAPSKGSLVISDDELRASLEGAQGLSQAEDLSGSRCAPDCAAASRR